jgi:hypothetical protein
MTGGFAVVLAALYRTISDILGHLPQRWIEDILAEEESDEAEDVSARAPPALRPGDVGSRARQ